MARRLYAPDPGAKLASMLGVPQEHRKSFEQPPTEVWACHWKTVRLLIAMSTQWRVGMNGAVGLDYGVLGAVARWLGIKVTPARFDQLRTLESEALTIFAEKTHGG